jgi:hypothetical protein
MSRQNKLRNAGKGMSPEQKRQYMQHLEMRAATIRGRMDDLRSRMKRAEGPDEYCRAASAINELSDYLDRYEEEIADLYCELEGID